MTKRVFIINGSGGVGKDTFIELVSRYAEVRNYSSVDEVKRIARYAGWDNNKDEKGRKLLSDLKDALTEYGDIPFNYLRKCVNGFHLDKTSEFCFLHIREPKEIQRAKEEFDAITVLVTRDNIEHITSNHADGQVLHYDYDIHIKNDHTLEYLGAVARKFVADYK